MANSLDKRIKYMQELAEELRGIAFHIEHTDVLYYGNKGCEHGKTKLLDDCGDTWSHDVWTLNKVASLFEEFFKPQETKNPN